MRKITLLLSFIACVAFTQAQTNLLVNPSFETWTDGTPAPWYAVSSSVTGSVITQDATIYTDGSKSFKIDAINASGTVSWSQVVLITGGKTYNLSMSYYISEGDGSDARIWCNFKNGTTFFSETDLIATGLYTKLRGPGAANSNGSEYFPDVKGSWKTYDIEFTAPTNADAFDFQFRAYKKAVVYWDKMLLAEKVNANVNNPNANKFTAVVSGKNLLVKGVQEGANVEIFSAIGSRVLSAAVVNGKIDMSTLSKGLYVVRVNKETQKILF